MPVIPDADLLRGPCPFCGHPTIGHAHGVCAVLDTGPTCTTCRLEAMKPKLPLEKPAATPLAEAS